jgi:serine protease Do
MNLSTELVKFFHVDISGQTKGQAIRTIEDFSKLKPEWEESLDLVSVFRICSRLEHKGFLIEATSQHQHPILGRSYLAPNFDARRADYGEYEFIGHGFALVADKLGPAVRPVVVTTPTGDEDIGTCFLLGNQCTLVTARHVVEGMSRVVIPDQDGNPINIRQIIVSENPNLDVAVILTDSLLSDMPYFRCSESSILDEVLCLGFPPIPGFEATLISDIATVNAELKASNGRVVASSPSYLDQQKYFLINARVKGGNSGGPIVNHQGYVVGILVQASMSSTELQSLDSLGYGVATPKSEWISLLNDTKTGTCAGVDLSFENHPEGGFQTAL